MEGDLLLRIRKMKVSKNRVGSSIPVIATGANYIPLIATGANAIPLGGGGGPTPEDQEDEGKSEQGRK